MPFLCSGEEKKECRGSSAGQAWRAEGGQGPGAEADGAAAAGERSEGGARAVVEGKGLKNVLAHA